MTFCWPAQGQRLPLEASISGPGCRPRASGGPLRLVEGHSLAATPRPATHLPLALRVSAGRRWGGYAWRGLFVSCSSLVCQGSQIQQLWFPGMAILSGAAVALVSCRVCGRQACTSVATLSGGRSTLQAPIFAFPCSLETG